MSTQSASNNHELENAFSTFNGLSEQLSTTYKLLVSQVENLESELVKTRDQRLQELAEKERLADRLSRLLNALPGGVVVLDRNGKVVEGNPVAFELLGEPLLDQSWLSIIQRAFVQQIDDVGELALHDGRRLTIATCPFGDQAGQVVLLQDVTESRRQQQQVNRLRRLSEMGEMTARLAHQIRTPLSSALLYVSHLDANKDSAANAVTQEKIRSRLRHLEKLVNDMLVFARGDCQGSDVIEVDGLMNEVWANSEEIASRQGCHINLELQADNATVRGNREVLHTALENLINNAVEACQSEGQVKLSSRILDAETVQLEVADNGSGIPDSIKARIFDPFFTTRNQGTGLGLAVVQAVARAHLGTLDMESSAGLGTQFRLRLPLIEKQAMTANLIDDSQSKEINLSAVQAPQELTATAGGQDEPLRSQW